MAWTLIEKLARRLYSTISPCIWCLNMHPNGHLMCETCLEQLPWIHNACTRCGIPLENTASEQRHCLACHNLVLAYDGVKTLFEYTWPCDQFISQMKFKKKLEYADWFAHLMAQRYLSPDKPSCLIPVPLHPQRLQERGFNQAYMLAQKLGETLSIPVAWDVVRKVKATHAQSSLSLAKRKDNLKDAFEMYKPLPFSWQSKVVIVDDVMTSGETVSSLAKTLKMAGAQYIEIWCCCRTLKPKISK